MTNIFNELQKLAQNACAPYSNYQVASIIETELGVYKGVNVENASYPASICAERAALITAVTAGARKVKAVHVLTRSSDTSGTPCGVCRQTLSEFMTADGLITCYNLTGQTKTYELGELLPYAFGPNSLNIK